MADYIQTVVTTAGTVTTTTSVNDTNMTRFTDWAFAVYPQFEADGTTLKPKNNANVADAVRDHHESTWRGVKDNVIRHERHDVAKTAIDGVPPIDDI